METNKIYHTDCMVGMQRIPNESIDLILCDLPYGVLRSKSNPHTAWDIPLPLDALWAQYGRIIKPRGAIILTATQPFATDLINSCRKWFRYELIWHKSRASGFLNARKMPNRCHENVLVFYKDLPAYYPQKYKVSEVFIQKRRCKTQNTPQSKAFKIALKDHYWEDDGTRHPDSILEFPSVGRKDMHPTEKPVELFRWLIRSYTQPGDIVLDNCIGSGTTAIAALLEKRRFIGFETEERFYQMALQRITELGTKKL